MKRYHFLLSVFFLSFFLHSCKEKQEEKPEQLRPVKYQVVGTADGAKIRSFTGAAKIGSDVVLSFRTGGVIEEKNASKGQAVKKGDLLGRLDNIEAKLAYEKALTELRSARSGMTTAKTNNDRIKSLYENGSKSLSDYEDARNQYENALSQFQAAQRNVSLQKTQLDYGYVYAPQDGIIAESNGGVNERVDAGHEFVVLNVAGGGMKVGINLPESVINQVKLNMKAKIEFSAFENESFDGEVVEISPVLDEGVSTYPVDVEIIDPSEDIKPGMAASVTFNFKQEGDTVDNSLVIPVKAVGEDKSGNFVFIVESENEQNGVVQKRRVTLGELTAEGFKVIDGVEAGQKIVTAGLPSLLDGQKVRLR